MPDVSRDLAMPRRGLVLVVGATGAGNSATLAAMLNYRNHHAVDHIPTIEDAVEFMFCHKRSIVNQGEIGLDTLSFAQALRSAMREAPDVVQVDEIRDFDTADACLWLANTGHLAMATMNATNTHQCLQRLVALFATSRREAMFMALSLNLQAIVCQRLLRGVDGRQRAVFEIWINTLC